MGPRPVVCIVGPSAAGKTTMSVIFSELTGGRILGASRFPRERYRTEKSELSLIEFVSQEFMSKGKDTFAKDLVAELAKHRCENGDIIDGFRTVEEVDYVTRNLSSPIVIGVFADSHTRFSRTTIRDRDGSITSYDELLAKDFVEYDYGVAKLLSQYAIQTLVNEGTLDEFRDKVKRVIISIGIL